MKRGLIYIVFTLSILLLPSPKGYCQEAEVRVSANELWESGNNSYVNREYAAAIASYNSILESGVSSAELFYNLANAHYKRGEIAKAILYYNKSLKLSPTDGDTLYNLTVAEEQTRDNIEEVPEFILSTLHRNMYSKLTSNQWAIFSLMTLIIAGVFMLLYMLNSQLAIRKIGFFGMLLSLILFASATSYSIGQRRESTTYLHAIVMSSSATVKSSPDTSATDLFILHEGTKVELGKEVGDWREVTISDGKRGWITSQSIEII